MTKHIVMWKLKNAADAPHFKAQLDSCRQLVPGMLAFVVAIRTAGLEANGDVVVYSVFDGSAALAAYQNNPITSMSALAWAPCARPAPCWITKLKATCHDPCIDIFKAP